MIGSINPKGKDLIFDPVFAYLHKLLKVSYMLEYFSVPQLIKFIPSNFEEMKQALAKSFA